jgi:DNA-binding NarL/FixJ family response regulator
MTPPIHVSILDDHQSIVDGYCFRLSNNSKIEVVATMAYGEELEPTLANHPTEVLILDINVPTSKTNANPYPILHIIPTLLQRYPQLNILVISMFAERSLIRAVMEAGASGYLLKDDQLAIRDLGSIVISVAGGGIYFSQKAHHLLRDHQKTDGEALTSRQLEALSLCAAYPDCATIVLAEKLTVSHSTVRNLLSGAYLRLGVHNRAAAIARARELGLITPHTIFPPK